MPLYHGFYFLNQHHKFYGFQSAQIKATMLNFVLHDLICSCWLLTSYTQ